MEKILFNTNTVFESDTYYVFDKSKCDIYLSDAKKETNPKYTTVTMECDRPSSLDTAFVLKGLKNVTLDFDGAVVTFFGNIQPFILDECENITIKNAVIGYKRPHFTEFDVISNDETELCLKVKDGFPYRIENGNFIPYCDEWEIRYINEGAHFLQAFDTETKKGKGFKLIYLGENIIPWENAPVKNIAHIRLKECGDKIIFKGTFPEHWDKGTSLVLAHTKRDLTSVSMFHSKDIVIENFRILNGGGMGYFAIYTENITLDNVKFVCDEVSSGLVTNAADGVHFVSCKGEIKVYNSIFNGMIDDCLNIHGNFHQVSEVSGEVLSVYRTQHYNNLGAEAKVYGIGDTIAVYNKSTMEEKGRFIIKDVNYTDDKWTTVIKTDKNLDGIEVDDVVENISANPSLHFKNNQFTNVNTHVRIQTRGKSLIEDCVFDIPLWLTGDMNYWFEASPVNDLTVRNCRFLGDKGNVALLPEFTVTEKAPYYHTGVTIENNTFDSEVALIAKYSDNIKFIGNKSSKGQKLIIEATGCGNIIEE